MKKIMFSDHFRLTTAVIDGQKTVTRRILKCPKKVKEMEVYGFNICRDYKGVIQYIKPYDSEERMIDEVILGPKFKEGEIIAVAQSYADCGIPFAPLDKHIANAGMSNKLFVKPSLMPHQIRIQDIRLERLQEISNRGALKEGIRITSDGMYYANEENPKLFSSPIEAFAYLIDNVSGKGTWDSNPWVWVYEFKLINKH